MQSIIDSTAVYEPTGIKRAASPPVSCVSLSCTTELHLLQHHISCGQVCSCKRRRTFDQEPPMVAQTAEEVRSPGHEASNLRDTIPNMMVKADTPFTCTQDSDPGFASASDERLKELKSPIIRVEEMEKAIKDSFLVVHGSKQEQPPGHAPSQTKEMDAFAEGTTGGVESRSDGRPSALRQQRRGHSPEGHSKTHNFYTQASILTSGGIVPLERVQVDETSLFNLLPSLIAMELDLIPYTDRILTIRIGDCLVHTNQYCRFTIRIGGLDTTINAGVISGLRTVLLGREWIRRVNLLSGLGNQSYYIPVPLAVETAKKLPHISDPRVETKEGKVVEMATFDEISEEYDDDSSSVHCDAGGELSSDGEHLLDDEPSSEVSSDGKSSSNGDTSGDEHSTEGDPLSGYELSLGDDPSSDDEISSSGEFILDEQSNEDDEICGDDEDYEGYEGEEYECGGCEDCEGYEDGEEDPDSDLQDPMEQYKCLEQFAEAERTEEAHDTEPDHESHTHSHLEDPFNRIEPKTDPTFDMGRHKLELRAERVFPSSHRDSQEKSTPPSPAKSQSEGAQTLITKRQARDLINILNHISRTQAGQSFKAPVEQLWPDFADAYAAKIPNPIDLGNIEGKVKNNMYYSIDDFRADVILLYQNSVDFNGIDHIITSTALEVRDTILKAISDIEESRGSTRASIRGL